MLVAVGAALMVAGGAGVVGPGALVAVGSVVPLEGTVFATNPAGRGVFVAVQCIVAEAPAFLALCEVQGDVPSYHVSYGSKDEKVMFDKEGEDVGLVFEGERDG